MQIDLFDKPPIAGNTIIWDGKKMSLDEAIKWAKLRVQLAPSFQKYREALDYLLKAKGKTHA